MADRPSGGPEEGSPEYHWLYGEKGGPADDETRALPQQPRGGRDPGASDGPDATRVMPAASRAARGQNRGSSARPAAGSPPPRPPAKVQRAGRSRWRRFGWGKAILALVVLWIAFLVVVPLIAWSKVDKVNAFPSGHRPDDQPGTTYLMVGSDSRGDLTAKQRKEYGTGNASGQRTDTIMLLHTGDGPNLLMSIPRDSLVEVPGHGTTKINAAFAYGGPRLLVKTIEQDTGIKIDDYVEIGFGGFVDLVDAVGGITICPKQAVNDKLAHIDIKKGCQEVDGPTALGYARSRHAFKNGDLDRAAHQREVVSAIGKKAVSLWTFLNPFRYWNLNMAAPKAVAVSDGTSSITMVKWAWAMTRVNGDSGLTCGVPVADFAVHWDAQRSKQMFDYIIKDRTADIPKSLCTPTGFPKG
jgi:LCP family protein required for cell wall assembly